MTCLIRIPNLFKKAYPAYFDTYEEIDTLIHWLNGIDNLYCVGRNGQHRYNNIDHSMCTSFEVVHNIVNGIRDRSNIWNVNTEKEYHEAKKLRQKRTIECTLCEHSIVMNYTDEREPGAKRFSFAVSASAKTKAGCSLFLT